MTRRSYVSRAPNVVPDSMTVRLKYSDSYDYVGTVSNFVSRVYRGNSIYDPDQTGVGHQAIGHDEWALLYSNYRVLSSKATVRVTASATGLSGLQCATLFPCTVNNTIASAFLAAEQPYAQTRIAGGAEGINVMYLSGNMKTKDMLGVKSIVYSGDFSAAMSSNPSKEWFWHVYIEALDQSSSISGIYQVEIEYVVELFGRTQLGQS